MANVTNAAGICCLALSLALQGKVSFSGTSRYTASLKSYYSLQEAAVHPDCVVSPQTVQDVSSAVRILTTTRASTNLSPTAGCQFAVRSGGHASFAGAASIEGGVTIDLSGLSDITLSSTRSDAAARPIASVGAGSTWGSVYARLDPLRLSVSGGRAGDVGVGGLTLGGGISYFGPRTGWTCDSVANFQVVLADGRVVNANDDENPDLSWALRGGTNNFGVVTRVDLQTFDQGDMWGGQVIRSFGTAEEQMVALAAFNDPDRYDEFASLITTFVYSGAQGQQVVVNDIVYTKPVADPAVFNTLTGIPTLSSTLRITNMSDLATETNVNAPNGLRQGGATLTIASTVAAINATVLAWNASIDSVHAIPGIVWGLGMDPLPPQLYARHAAQNALGLDHRQNKALIIINLNIMWSDAADDDAVDRAIRALVAAIRRHVDVLDPFLYINYAASWQQPIEGYGKASVERLRKVQNLYDPRRVFTDLVPGGFKIREGVP